VVAPAGIGGLVKRVLGGRIEHHRQLIREAVAALDGGPEARAAWLAVPQAPPPKVPITTTTSAPPLSGGPPPPPPPPRASAPSGTRSGRCVSLSAHGWAPPPRPPRPPRCNAAGVAPQRSGWRS
jgi:hypothetical protein